MLRAIAVLTTLLATSALTGCGTFFALDENGHPFGGVVLDGTIIAKGAPDGLPLPGGDLDVLSLWPLAIVDLPLSLAGDVVLLPLTITFTLLKQRASSPSQAALPTAQ